MLTEPAARAPSGVQAELRTAGLGLLVYDAYRPTTAVADFVDWAKDLTEVEMKARFYPDVRKSELFREGCIAAGFDLFSLLSWPSSLDVPAAARAHPDPAYTGAGPIQLLFVPRGTGLPRGTFPRG